MELHRMMKLLGYCLVLLLMYTDGSAQRCDTYEYYKKFPVSSNLVTARVTDNSKPVRDTIANEVITIPVVIHVLYNNPAQNISDAQILSQLEALNNDYRRANADASNTPKAFTQFASDTRITFCLAKVDNSGKPTTGIIRKSTTAQSWTADDGMKYSAQGGDDAWDSKRYLNIWVVNLYGRSLGYSSLPGSQSDQDGVVVQYNAFGTKGNLNSIFNKGRTLTHEVGHWLGLKHIWGDATCGDDGIADTPPQQNFNNGCTSFPHRSSCSINGNGDMFMNFMDFSDDACMNMFTIGQATKMRSLFAAGGTRNSFLSSNAGDSNAIQRAAAPAQTTTVKPTISLFPNPAIKFITVEGKTSAEVVGKTVKICNAFGGVMISQILSTQKTSITIQQLPSGIYFLKVGDGNETKPIRFIKE